jgi:hypothetical protein
MRAPYIVFSLCLLLCSWAQGADETAPSPAASDPNAASRAPVATTSESAAPPEVAPAASDEASSTQVGEAVAKDPHVTETGTANPAAPGSFEEKPKIGEMTKEEQKAMDVEMRRRGYTTKTIDGEKRYCKATTVLGSRFNSKTICFTADQIKSQQDAVQKVREKQGQRETWGQ